MTRRTNAIATAHRLADVPFKKARVIFVYVVCNENLVLRVLLALEVRVRCGDDLWLDDCDGDQLFLAYSRLELLEKRFIRIVVLLDIDSNFARPDAHIKCCGGTEAAACAR